MAAPTCRSFELNINAPSQARRERATGSWGRPPMESVSARRHDPCVSDRPLGSNRPMVSRSRCRELWWLLAVPVALLAACQGPEGTVPTPHPDALRDVPVLRIEIPGEPGEVLASGGRTGAGPSNTPSLAFREWTGVQGDQEGILRRVLEQLRGLDVLIEAVNCGPDGRRYAVGRFWTPDFHGSLSVTLDATTQEAVVRLSTSGGEGGPPTSRRNPVRVDGDCGALVRAAAADL